MASQTGNHSSTSDILSFAWLTSVHLHSVLMSLTGTKSAGSILSCLQRKRRKTWRVTEHKCLGELYYIMQAWEYSVAIALHHALYIQQWFRLFSLLKGSKEASLPFQTFSISGFFSKVTVWVLLIPELFTTGIHLSTPSFLGTLFTATW